MKRLSTHWVAGAFLLLAIPLLTYAQQVKSYTQPLSGPYVINFSELAQQELLNPPPTNYRDPEADEAKHKPFNRYLPVSANAPVTQITLPQAKLRVQSPPPVISFNGLLDNHTLYP